MSQQQNKKPNVVATGMPMAPQKPVNVGQSFVAPSPGIIPRMLGGVMSDRMAARNPEVEKAWAGRQVEFPEAAAKVNRIGEMGYLKKMISGGAYGSTSPFGTIELNMDAIRRDKQDVSDVLAHEMEHARQGAGAWFREKFRGDMEPEHKAINTEVFRKVRKGDIPLRPPMNSVARNK